MSHLKHKSDSLTILGMNHILIQFITDELDEGNIGGDHSAIVLWGPPRSGNTVAIDRLGWIRSGAADRQRSGDHRPTGFPSPRPSHRHVAQFRFRANNRKVSRLNSFPIRLITSVRLLSSFLTIWQDHRRHGVQQTQRFPLAFDGCTFLPVRIRKGAVDGRLRNIFGRTDVPTRRHPPHRPPRYRARGQSGPGTGRSGPRWERMGMGREPRSGPVGPVRP